jgi:phage terminase large subunit-like protein
VYFFFSNKIVFIKNKNMSKNSNGMGKNVITRDSIIKDIYSKNESIYDLAQQEVTLNTVRNIISMLPDDAFNELLGGYSNDIDRMINSIIKETNSVIHANIVPNLRVHSASFEGQAILQASVEEGFRLSSLAYFILTVLPHFTLEPVHIEWSKLVEEYNRLVVKAPRGHGKSYFFTYANVLWSLYRYAPRNEKVYVPFDRQMCREIMLFTNEISLAENLLGIIGDELRENERLNERLYVKATTNKQSIICKNGSKILAKSSGSKARGYHPTKVILDDYLNDQVISSGEQNKKYIDHFFSVISNCLEPNGQMLIVGTPFTQTDLYSELEKKKFDKGTSAGKRIYTCCTFPAINPKSGSVLIPSRFTWDKLMEKRSTYGETIFSRELLCIPVSEASTIFTDTVLNVCTEGMEDFSLVSDINNYKIKEFDRVVTGVDLALSSNVGSDYTVIVTFGVHNKKAYLLNVERFKTKRYNEQILALQKVYSRFTPDIIVIESNNFQKIMGDLALEHGLPIKTTYTGNAKKDLYYGLPAVAVLMERGQVKIPNIDNIAGRGIQRTIRDEFSNISFNETTSKLENAGGHDDLAHAMWFALVEIFSTRGIGKNSILDYMDE